MAKIKTKNFGVIDIAENQKITFPEGILGFEDEKEYYLIIKDDSPFLWLQSAKTEGLAFVLINPYLFIRDYHLAINQRDWDVIQIDPHTEDFLVLAIVTIPENPEDMTANLQGPIIINPKKKLGMQAISLNDEYGIRHPILQNLKTVLSQGDK